MTPQEMLDAATKEFEATFKHVAMGQPVDSKHTPLRWFSHVDGSVHDYIEVMQSGPRGEGEASIPSDSAEDAVNQWRNAVRQFEGNDYLYWRRRPEIDQDTSPIDLCYGDDRPNPRFGKWFVYSRFRALK